MRNGAYDLERSSPSTSDDVVPVSERLRNSDEEGNEQRVGTTVILPRFSSGYYDVIITNVIVALRSRIYERVAGDYREREGV